jgi:hypothetical protein
VGHADTAFAQRQAEYYVGIETQWTDLAESEAHIRWTRTLSDALKPHSSGGYLLNFLGGEEIDAVRAAFGTNHATKAPAPRPARSNYDTPRRIEP